MTDRPELWLDTGDWFMLLGGTHMLTAQISV
jgi:hypothetical protein